MAGANTTEVPRPAIAGCDRPSLQLSIAVPDAVAASIRIDSAGDAPPATVALDRLAPPAIPTGERDER